jgi:DNA-binding NarL/FixJ family response regulator
MSGVGRRGTVLLVDDHRLFADAIATVLGRLDRDLRVVPCASAEDALERLANGPKPDLVLLDLGLPGLRGIHAFRALAAAAPGAPIVIVTASDPTPEMHRMVREGARGVVHKRASAAELLAVLRVVRAGGTHVPAELLAVATTDQADELTDRQRDVLVLLAGGASNKEIADRLGIAEATVRVHVSSVLRTLGVENRTQAATSAVARRLVGA